MDLIEPKIYMKIQRVRLESAYQLLRKDLEGEGYLLHVLLLDMIWDAKGDSDVPELDGVDPDAPIPYEVVSAPDQPVDDLAARLSAALEDATRDRDHFMKCFHDLEAKWNALSPTLRNPFQLPTTPEQVPVDPTKTVVKPAPRKAATTPAPREKVKPGPPEREIAEDEFVELASGTRVYEKKPHDLTPIEMAQSIWFIFKNDRDGLTMNRVGTNTEQKIRELYATELAELAAIKEFYKVGAYKQKLQAQIQREGVRRYSTD